MLGRGGQLSMGTHSTHKIFGLNLAKHVHRRMEHVHWSSHGETVS